LDIVEPIVEAAAPARQEIVLQTPAARVERKKPAAISLAPPSTPVSAASVSGRAPIRLSEATDISTLSPAKEPVSGRAPLRLSEATVGAPWQGSAAPAEPSARLYDEGHGIFSIEIAASVPSDVIVHLRQALERVQEEPSIKALILSGLECGFGRGGREEYNQA